MAGQIERLSSSPVIDVSTRKQYMYFIDKQGYVARTLLKHGVKLDPAELRRREQEKLRKKQAFEKRIAESKERKRLKAEQVARKAKERYEQNMRKAKELGA